MSTLDVILPQLGMGMQEAEIVRWLKAVGDPVAAGEPLVELASEKSTVEFESPHAGVLAAIVAAEGATVPVGSCLAQIEG